MATALRRLRELNLAYDEFKRIPAAVGKIVTLQTLDMSYNQELELGWSDLDTLAALSKLKKLCIFKCLPSAKPPGRFSPASLDILEEIFGRFPDLMLPSMEL